MSLLKDLESLCQPAPALPDTEDGVEADFNSISDKAIYNEEYSGKTNLRKRFGTMELNDPRYEGAVVSSKEVFGEMNEPREFHAEGSDSDSRKMNSEELGAEALAEKVIDLEHTLREANTNHAGMIKKWDDNKDKVASQARQIAELKERLHKQKKKIIKDEGDTGDESDVNEETDEESEKKVDIEKQEEDGNSPVILKPVSSDREDKKAVAVRRQITIFDQLLYLKIKLHASMRVYNELPRGRRAQELLKSANSETKKNYDSAKRNAAKIVSALLAAEEALLSSCPQTKKFLEGCGRDAEKDDSDDEEIESSEDEKDNGSDGYKLDNDEPIPDYNFSSDYESGDEENNDDFVVANEFTSKMSHAEIGRRLAHNIKRFDAFRRSTIDKWDERTRLLAPKGKRDKKGEGMSVFEDGTLSQIDKILRDKQRLIRRTRTKRSNIERIGGNADVNEDPETFDDNDFYQSMLKELIEKKSAQVVDPLTITRQWLEVQKLRDDRGKKKYKNLNTAKERKIRYQVIPKLVNFHAAVPESVPWTHEMRNELFKSLFAT